MSADVDIRLLVSRASGGPGIPVGTMIDGKVAPVDGGSQAAAQTLGNYPSPKKMCVCVCPNCGSEIVDAEFKITDPLFGQSSRQLVSA